MPVCPFVLAFGISVLSSVKLVPLLLSAKLIALFAESVRSVRLLLLDACLQIWGRLLMLLLQCEFAGACMPA